MVSASDGICLLFGGIGECFSLSFLLFLLLLLFCGFFFFFFFGRCCWLYHRACALHPVVHPKRQSSRTSNVSSLLQWRSPRMHKQPQIPRDPLRQNADVQEADQNMSVKKDCPLKAVASKGIGQRHLFLLYHSVSLTTVWVSQPCDSLTCCSSTGCKTKP